MAKIPAAARSGRLQVLKTYKMYVGGAFIRSESGKVVPALSPDGKTTLAQICRGSRKDFRDAVVAARKAFGKWSGAVAYLKGQILYRAAEMLEMRAEEMEHEIARNTGCTPAAARREVADAVELLVHYAGWTDKFAAVFGSVNPVSSPHFNFTYPEGTGVVVIFCPDKPCFVALVHLIAATILTGNTCIVIPSETAPLPALTFGEILATSDLPSGVVNILSGLRADIAPTAATHMDVNAIVNGCDDAALDKMLHAGTATNMKRYARHAVPSGDWRVADRPQWILDTIEFKTAWHPVGW
ncbi:MAG: aldehyde dehydrogenase family protein [Chthoniobacterales bacterium]|jgi:acyl-CoA reductase-like NAD-dependent aldehyde dehydrogenase|nr:aldehyde dehydrogenase family protein [Chthoniobacterales bacterium]